MDRTGRSWLCPSPETEHARQTRRGLVSLFFTYCAHVQIPSCLWGRQNAYYLLYSVVILILLVLMEQQLWWWQNTHRTLISLARFWFPMKVFFDQREQTKQRSIKLVLFASFWIFACRYVAGSLEFYDRSYDRVNAKMEKKLKRMNRTVHTVTTTDDPIIRKVPPPHDYLS